MLIYDNEREEHVKSIRENIRMSRMCPEGVLMTERSVVMRFVIVPTNERSGFLAFDAVVDVTFAAV